MEINVESLYRRYGPMVMRHCCKMLGDETLALDATQDVFVKLLVYRDKLEEQAPSSLLYTIATNICLNKIRARKNYEKVIQNGSDPSLIERIASFVNVERQALTNRFLTRFLKRQSKSTQLILVLYLVEGLTLEQVAQEVGMSESGVRKRLKGLRSKIEEIELY